MLTKYNKNDTYLLACSGGPDSMALLSMLINNSFKVIVAHVNYKTRDESDSEEQLVKDFCSQHNIKCYVSIFDHNYKGNFEDAARKFRYKFFEKIYFENNCSGLFVAHHKDDLIETYLLKKQRNVVNESYLIKEQTIINKMNVIRPLLLNFYKEDLLKYCNNNNIPYGIDKTNFMDIHLRNVIRKKLLTLDKEEIYKKALEEEENLINTRNEVKKYLKYYPVYLISSLSDKSDLWLMIFLYESCDIKYKRYVNKSLLLTLKDFINSDKPSLIKNVNSSYYLIKKYNEISYVFIEENECYQYILNKLEYIVTPHFKIVDKGLKMHGIYVSDDDFPLTIRSYKNDDKIKLKEGNKKITRLFIDKKVPLFERNKFPVIENKNHEIIFVYKLYRKYGYKTVKNNLFIELKKIKKA